MKILTKKLLVKKTYTDWPEIIKLYIIMRSLKFDDNIVNCSMLIRIFEICYIWE